MHANTSIFIAIEMLFWNDSPDAIGLTNRKENASVNCVGNWSIKIISTENPSKIMFFRRCFVCQKLAFASQQQHTDRIFHVDEDNALSLNSHRKRIHIVRMDVDCQFWVGLNLCSKLNFKSHNKTRTRTEFFGKSTKRVTNGKRCRNKVFFCQLCSPHWIRLCWLIDRQIVIDDTRIDGFFG